MDLLAGLTESQRAAVTAPLQPLCVIAPAGSGKTRVLTQRVAWRVNHGDADPRFSIVVTFTRKAAEELRSRLMQLRVPSSITSGTFHAIAYAQLRRWWADSGRAPLTIAERPARLVKSALQQLLEEHGRTETVSSAAIDDAVSAIASEISWAKTSGLSPDDYARTAVRRHRAMPSDLLTDFHDVARVFGNYNALLARKRVIDFDDVLLHAIEAFTSDQQFCDAQRHLIRHVFVDEAQDLTPTQLTLLRCWMGTNTDLFLVGDPNQAIYGWSGSDATMLTKPEMHIPGVAVLRLEESFRSTQAIINAAQTVLDPGGIEPRPVRFGGSTPTITAYDSDADEARGVADACLAKLASGHRSHDIAILARTRAQLPIIAAALKSADIAHRVISEISDDVAVSGDPQDGVRLLTFHAAKGLEWSSVFVVGLEEGLMPLGRGNSMEADAEEQRLFYVALTRAENDLHCSWAQSRKFGRSTRSRRPSPWLAQLAIRIAENETANVVQATQLASEARGALADLQQVAKNDERKRERTLQSAADSKTIREREDFLRHWRRGQARGADAAEEIVLPEQALLVAAAMPPETEHDVAKLPGVGAIRAIHLAPRLLQALKSF